MDVTMRELGGRLVDRLSEPRDFFRYNNITLCFYKDMNIPTPRKEKKIQIRPLLLKNYL